MKEYILPLRDLVMHPGLTVPVLIDNPMSVACIEAAAKNRQKIVLAAQHTWGYPANPEDVYDIGTIGDIAQVLRMPDGAVHVMIRTTDAVTLSDISVDDGIFTGVATPIAIMDDSAHEQTIALRDKVAKNLQLLSGPRKIKMDKLRTIIQDYPLPAFIDSVMQIMDIDTDIAVRVLCAPTWRDKLVILLEQVNLMLETAKIEESINRRIHQQMESGRREAILQEKMRAIQREMGDDSEEIDTENLRKRIEKSPMPADAKEKAMSEWRRMRSMSPMSNEGGLLKTYLDELLSMPWNKSDKVKIDLKSAREILDSQHSGMQGVKERILEHIAVMKKTGSNRGTILCMVGAPGVGKTSLGKSIAAALGRKYQRISLGGISDEAHFRGHRKTYIGAQTGRIMDALKRCKTNNPVIVLDEIDKMGRDWRGDPEAALLEILDPEQNKTFRDHYLEVDFDLSNVLFIATANSMNLSSALKDRMEIIEIPGYSMDDKIRIAREHLIARAAHDTGWDMANIDISDNAIRHLVQNYTSEDGVRELQRELTAILRRALLENDGEDVRTEFTPEKIDQLLSVRKSAGFSKRIGFGIRA
ncbi:MAG: AAA family ATPase [Alphaproteobacteria bacterium]|nr:AAA family ATPase [Alphaproteobacteria bacterium]MDE6570815.1 AAA family ATPase [Alphaproteobacteria bacterium]